MRITQQCTADERGRASLPPPPPWPPHRCYGAGHPRPCHLLAWPNSQPRRYLGTWGELRQRRHLPAADARLGRLHHVYSFVSATTHDMDQVIPQPQQQLGTGPALLPHPHPHNLLDNPARIAGRRPSIEPFQAKASPMHALMEADRIWNPPAQRSSLGKPD